MKKTMTTAAGGVYENFMDGRGGSTKNFDPRERGL